MGEDRYFGCRLLSRVLDTEHLLLKPGTHSKGKKDLMKSEHFKTVRNSIFIQIINNSISFVSLPVNSVVLFAGYSF